VIGLMLALTAAAVAPAPVEVVVVGLDRRFEGAVAPIPLRESGIEAVLSLSEVGAELHAHRLELRPMPSGCCAARVELDISGSAAARLEVVGTPLELDDSVVAPRQKLLLDGRVQLEVSEAGGVTLTLVEGPQTIAARVESRLGDSLGMMCVLVVGSGPCGALIERLTRVEIPGPVVGARLELPSGAVDPTTVERLRGLLSW
jgi:hypothetical protein